jgi:hypothetical protein
MTLTPRETAITCRGPHSVVVASAAILASTHIDAERPRLYLHPILIALSQNAPEVLVASMNSFGHECDSDFARRYIAEVTEGYSKGESRAAIILRLVALRFGPLKDVVRTRVSGAQDSQLDALAEGVLTAQTLQEALGALS